MISREQLKALESQHKGLIDISGVAIDRQAPIAERFSAFAEQIRNPYCFLCNGTPVKINFTSNGKHLEDIISSHFIRNK